MFIVQSLQCVQSEEIFFLSQANLNHFFPVPTCPLCWFHKPIKHRCQTETVNDGAYKLLRLVYEIGMFWGNKKKRTMRVLSTATRLSVVGVGRPVCEMNVWQ